MAAQAGAAPPGSAEFAALVPQRAEGAAELLLPEPRLAQLTGLGDLLAILALAGVPKFALGRVGAALSGAEAGSGAAASAGAAEALVQDGHGTGVWFRAEQAHQGAMVLLQVRVLAPCPGRAFAGRVEGLLAVKRALLHTNAAISTLGGGHFLCGHLSEARGMAAKQLAVARALGDEALFARVHLHFVYIALQAGQLATGLRIARALEAHGATLRDKELVAMAHAAAVLIERLSAAAPPAPGADGSDDFARYRGALAGAAAS